MVLSKGHFHGRNNFTFYCNAGNYDISKQIIFHTDHAVSIGKSINILTYYGILFKLTMQYTLKKIICGKEPLGRLR
jgi:hypothetical protein